MARELSYNLADGAPLWNVVQGMDRSVVPVRIPDLGLYEAYNVVLLDGRIQPRPGARESDWVDQPAGAPAGPCNYLANFQRKQGGQYLYRGEADFAAATMDVYGWDSATWSSKLSGLSTSRDTPPQSAQFKDAGIFVPGDGPMYQWSASTLGFSLIDNLQTESELQPPEKIRFITATGSRVFAANGLPPGSSDDDERIGYRVWWSTTGDNTIWSNGTGRPDRGSASYQDLQHDSYPITGMVFHSGQAVMVFKRWSIYLSQWRGSPVWYDFVPLTTATGCIASETIKKWGNLMIFLGADFNVHVIGLNGQIQALGGPIQPLIQAIIDKDRANRSVAVVDYEDNLYWLFVPSATDDEEAPQHIFCLNLETGAWSQGKISGFQVVSAHTWQPSYTFQTGVSPPDDRSTQRLLLGGSDGKIYEFDYQTAMADGGTDWNAYVWSRMYDFAEVYKDLGETGEIHKMMLHGDSGAAIAKARLGKTVKGCLNASATQFDEVDQDAANPVTYVSDRTDAQRFAQWGVEWGSGEDSPMEIEGVTVWALPRGENR